MFRPGFGLIGILTLILILIPLMRSKQRLRFTEMAIGGG